MADALSAAAQQLAQADVDSPRLAAEVLAAHALGLARAQLATSDAPIPQPLFQALVDRCASGEPLAYVVGHKAFYDLDLACDPRALIPRPETELLVETILNFKPTRSSAAQAWALDVSTPSLVDVGTGTGCIAVTLAAHWPGARVYATDVSPEALALARYNAERCGVSERIVFLQGDLLAGLPGPVHVIAANLPYVTTAEWEALPRSIRLHEPRLALDGGADGLDQIRRLLAPAEAPAYLLPGGVLVLEIGSTQGPAAAQLVRAAFPAARVQVKQDYAGLDRLVVAET